MHTLIVAKRDLTPHELNILQFEYQKRKRSRFVTWLLWLAAGIVGGHRYYLGHNIQGLLMTITLGGLGIWAFINLFYLNRWVDEYNAALESGIIEQIKAARNETAAG